MSSSLIVGAMNERCTEVNKDRSNGSFQWTVLMDLDHLTRGIYKIQFGSTKVERNTVVNDGDNEC